MSKLKIEHGISRVKRAKLQTYIDQSVADDITLMSEFTNNEQHYIVNELLRFALAQSEDFQRYKTEHVAKHPEKIKDPHSHSFVSTIVPTPTSTAAQGTRIKPNPMHVTDGNRKSEENLA